MTTAMVSDDIGAQELPCPTSATITTRGRRECVLHVETSLRLQLSFLVHERGRVPLTNIKGVDLPTRPTFKSVGTAAMVTSTGSHPGPAYGDRIAPRRFHVRSRSKAAV